MIEISMEYKIKMKNITKNMFKNKMNSNFPLYKSLSQDIPTSDLTAKQKTELLKLIKNIDNNGCERIYVLIKTHQIENSTDKNALGIPYQGKYVKTDLEFDLNELPNELRQILYKFVKIHTETMNEENDLNKNRDIIL